MSLASTARERIAKRKSKTLLIFGGYVMSICHNALYKDLQKDVSEFVCRHHFKTFNQPISSQELSLLLTDPDIDHRTYAALTLHETFLKKFQDGHSMHAEEAALGKFLASNVQCQGWSIRQDRSLEEDLLLGLFKQNVYRFFNRHSRNHILSSLSTIVTHGSNGPGASVGAQGTDFYTKFFSSPFTATSKGLFSIFENYIDNIPFWRDAEKLRHEQFGDVNIVEGNRLSFVPKNVDTSRCICTEPSLNMFFQQGVKTILEKRLIQFFGIDLANQQVYNKALAKRGSETETFCTIDLSQASDSVSLHMIRETFPRDVVTWLELFRSPKVQLPDGSWQELHMISSMGNAFTFPLETLIFSCVVSAAYQMKDLRLYKGKRDCKSPMPTVESLLTKPLPNFGVFGDDIIVLKECYRQTVMLLNMLGFTVNAEKSFSEGPFRESCGGDYFRGHPVRGVYLKTLKTQASRYVAINRLNIWSAKTGIPLTRAVRYLMKRVRYLPIPLYENDDAGVKVPLSMVKDRKKCKRTQSIMYRRWANVPQTIRIIDGALKLPRGARKRLYNADGLFVAALRGDIRDYTFGSRLGPARYSTKVAIAPSWDWLPAVSSAMDDIDQRRLADAIEANLTS